MSSAYLGDLLGQHDPQGRDRLLKAVGCAPWPVIRRTLPELDRRSTTPAALEGAVRKQRQAPPPPPEISQREIERLIENRGGGELGSAV